MTPVAQRVEPDQLAGQMKSRNLNVSGTGEQVAFTRPGTEYEDIAYRFACANQKFIFLKRAVSLDDAVETLDFEIRKAPGQAGACPGATSTVDKRWFRKRVPIGQMISQDSDPFRR